MSPNELREALAIRFPTLSKPLAAEAESWAPDDPGFDIVLGDYFVPYVMDKLGQEPLDREELGEVFEFIEELASDAGLRPVVAGRSSNDSKETHLL